MQLKAKNSSAHVLNSLIAVAVSRQHLVLKYNLKPLHEMERISDHIGQIPGAPLALLQNRLLPVQGAEQYSGGRP